MDYGPGFEGTCDPVTVTVHFQSEVEGGDPPYAYAWEFGDGSASSDPNPSHTYTVLADYTIVLRVTDSSGVVAQDSLELLPPPPPCASLSWDIQGGSLWILLVIVAVAVAVLTVLAVALPRIRRARNP